MSDTIHESLSALIDGEANELDYERVLGRLGEDDALRWRWMRYNAAHKALAGRSSLAHFDLDVSRAVSAALAVAPQQARPRVVTARRLLRPLSSFAVAASVAAIAVIGGQWLAQPGGVTGQVDAGTLAARPSPVGMLNSLGATPVRASLGTQGVPMLPPATNPAYDDLARQRMLRYMQTHAEQAALNSPQGLVPYARVPQPQE